jgi:hypothetical protein
MQTKLGATLTIKQPILDDHTQNKQLKKQKCEQKFFKKQKVISKSTRSRAFRDYKRDERRSSQRTLKFQECMKYV